MTSLLSTKNLNRFFYFLIAVLMFVCVKQAMKHDLDFQVFYKVGQQFLAGDYDFYQLVEYPGWPYRYGPLFPVLMAPLAMLAKTDAQLIWSIFNALLIPFAWFFSEQVLVRRVGAIVQSPGPRIVTLLLVLDYITRNASLGNVNMLMYLSLIWGIDLSDRKKPIWAGLVIGLGASIKVFSGTAALYFLCSKRWREFAWTVLMTAFFTFGAPAVVYGPGMMVEMIQKWMIMLQDRGSYPFFKYINQSPLAVFWRITGHELATKVLNVLFILVAFLGLGWLTLRRWRSNASNSEKQKLDLMILLVSIAMPLFVLACVYIEYHLIAIPIILTVNAYVFQKSVTRGWLAIYWLRIVLVNLAVLEIAGRPLTEKLGSYGNHLWGVVALLLMVYFHSLRKVDPAFR